MTATDQDKSIGNLGKYALLQKLGEGHLGSVFKAFHPGCDKPVAVRIMCDGIRWDAALEVRFYHECRAIAELQHPNIAAILDFGKAGQSRYMAMEFLGGDDLGSLIARKPALTVETKLSIMIQASDGLNHAHSRGILHRALKPGKIHLASDGCPKIRDFGFAHLLRKYLIRPGVRWGAPLYMPPEEIQHTGCDGRSDVFSAGVVFYELLTGLHPFHDQNSNKAVDRILFETDIPTLDQFPDLPPGIWAILDKCLAKDPADRYQSISDFSNACRDLLKDMAEDSQLMLAELQAALPKLRKAAARPGSSRGTIALCEEIQTLSGDQGKTDYASLDRLMAVLTDQYPTLQAISGEPVLGPVFPPLASGEPTVAPERPAEPAPPSTGEADAQELPEDACVPSAGEAAPPIAALEPESRPSTQLPLVVPLRPSYAYRTVARPSFRMAAALLSVLLIATALYVFRESGAAASLQSAWSAYMQGPGKASPPGLTDSPQHAASLAGAAGAKHPSDEAVQLTVKVLLDEARTLASQQRLYESRVLIHRIMELSPNNEAATALLEEMGAVPALNETNDAIPKDLLEQLGRVSYLIRSGRLQQAKADLDRLQLTYPDAPALVALRKKWEKQNSLVARDQARKDDEERTAAQQRKEEEWTRRVADLYAQGNYSEARGALTLWLADDPANSRAREMWDRNEAVQRDLQACETALAGGKFQDALNALDHVERLNPADPNLADLRRRVDSRKAAARATLTVRRLGDRATLLLDGKPAGSDGEIRNETVAIGYHTIGVENATGYHASKNQEFLEGQTVVYVYDTAARILRPMAEADAGLIAQRETREELHRFYVEHSHGVLRGSCKGVLSFNYFEVEFKPDSGDHGFKVPFKRLMLKADGKSLDFFHASTGKYISSLRVQSALEAEDFRRAWEKLEASGR